MQKGWIWLFLLMGAGCSSPGYTREQLRWPWPENQKLIASNLLDGKRQIEDIPYLPPGRKLEDDTHPKEAQATFSGYDERLKLPTFQPAGDNDIIVWYLTKGEPFVGPNAEMIQIYSFPSDLMLEAQYDPFPADKIGWTVYLKEEDGTWKWVDREEIRKDASKGTGPFKIIRNFFERRNQARDTSSLQAPEDQLGNSVLGIYQPSQ